MADPTKSDRTPTVHPLGKCAFCGSTYNLYATYLLSTHSMAAICEDTMRCLRRRSDKKTKQWLERG